MLSSSTINYALNDARKKTYDLKGFWIKKLLQIENNVITFLVYHPNGDTIVAYDLKKKVCIKKISGVDSARLVGTNDIVVTYKENKKHAFEIFFANSLEVHYPRFELENPALILVSTCWNGKELYFDNPHYERDQNKMVAYNVETQQVREIFTSYYSSIEVIDDNVIVSQSEETSILPSLMYASETFSAENDIHLETKLPAWRGTDTTLNSNIANIFSIAVENVIDNKTKLQLFSRADSSYQGSVSYDKFFQYYVLLADERSLICYSTDIVFSKGTEFYCLDLMTGDLTKISTYPKRIKTCMAMQDGSLLVACENSLDRLYFNHCANLPIDANNFVNFICNVTPLIPDLVKIVYEYCQADTSYTQFTPNHLSFFPKIEEEKPAPPAEDLPKNNWGCLIS